MRTNNSIRNIAVALIGQFIGVMLSFIGRIVFIYYLGAEYLGVSGLFSNILSLLSLAELGVGSAISYSLYKPLATGNTYKVKALMRFYERAYGVIGGIIAILGMGLIPFLDIVIKEDLEKFNLTLIYILFLMNTVCSYFFAYKRSLIIADQKNYITTIFRYTFYVIVNIVQILILILFRSYILFLLAQIIITLLENICVAYKADKMYPYLRNGEKAELTSVDRQEIIRNVKAMMCHRLGGTVINGTDNIIISSFIGITWVGLYSNYYLIINALNIIIGQVFNAITASVGNLNAMEGKERSYMTYKRILFMNFWMAGICSIMLWILCNPFITLWLGKKYIFTKPLVFVIIINFYMKLVRNTTLLFRDSMGLFWNDRYKPLFEAGINILVSIILALKIGILGVFIGTLVSTVTTSFWVEPYILYRYGFRRKVRAYFFLFIKYTIFIIIDAIITYFIGGYITDSSWGMFIVKGVICFLTSNIVWMLCAFKSEELEYFVNIGRGTLISIVNKVKGDT